MTEMYRSRVMAWTAGATAAVTLVVIVAWPRLIDARPAPSPSSKPLPDQLFQGWPQPPLAAIVLSGEQHSYLKFCGCSSPQLGGFERRYNFVAKLRDRGWTVDAFDLGDIVHYKGGVHEQSLLKYETSMKALEAIGYSAVGLGQHDFDLPLLEGLSRFTLQKPEAFPKVLSANLKDRALNFPLNANASMISGGVAVGAKVRIGACAVVSPTVAKLIQDRSISFDPPASVIAQTQKRFTAEGVQLRVLLYQGHSRDADAANLFNGFDVVLCNSPEEEPTAQPLNIGSTLVVQVGHKGRYIGVVGIYPGTAGRKYDLRYQLVSLGEEYETDQGQEANHPILKLLEGYSKQLKDGRFLAKHPQIPHTAQGQYPGVKLEFAGSESCQQCHAAEYEKWRSAQHSHAYAALEHIAKKPSHRQYDAECIVCHTVGFGLQSGYSDELKTAHLKNVGCESCHGPGSAHNAEPQNTKYWASLSPWKYQPTDRLPDPDKLTKPDLQTPSEKATLHRVDAVCQKCHDVDNDPKYGKDRFEGYWPKIDHSRMKGKMVAK